jgi:hypothetical protein
MNEDLSPLLQDSLKRFTKRPFARHERRRAAGARDA